MNTSAKELGHFDHLKWTGHYRDLYSCFRATDARTGQEVTLRLFDLRRHDPDLRARIDAALDELLFLRHPNLIPVWEAGEVDDIPYLVTPTVTGQTLAELLANPGGDKPPGAGAGRLAGFPPRYFRRTVRAQQAPPLPPAQSTAILAQIGAALEYLHQCGSVHGDLCPETVIVKADGGVLLDAVCMYQLAAPSTDKTDVVPDFGSFDQDFGRRDHAREDTARYHALSRLLRTSTETKQAHQFQHRGHTTLTPRVVPVVVVDSGRPATMPDPRLFQPTVTAGQGTTTSSGFAELNARNPTQGVGIGQNNAYPNRITQSLSSESPPVTSREIRMSPRATTLVSLAVLALLLMTAYLLWQPLVDPSAHGANNADAARAPELSVSAGGSSLPTATPTGDPDPAELTADVGAAGAQPQDTATPAVTDTGTVTGTGTQAGSAQPSLTPTATITPTETLQPSPAASAEVTATVALASSTAPAQTPME